MAKPAEEARAALAAHWSTERIREAFIDDGGLAEYHDPINGAREQRRIAGEIFDAWLAEHDRALLARGA